MTCSVFFKGSQSPAMNEPEFLTIDSITASGRPASLGGLLVALLTMLSLGIQQPAAAQDVDLPSSLRNPLQDPHRQGSHHPRWSRSLRRAGYGGDVLGRCGSHGADATAEIERTIGVPVLIETVETLKGETIDEVATRLARGREPRASSS